MSKATDAPAAPPASTIEPKVTLPSHEEAVKNVKAAMLDRCKEEKLDSETLFSEFVPSSLDDDLIWRTALTRNFDYPNAAKRVIKLCRVLNDLGMTADNTLTRMDDDVEAGLSLGCFVQPVGPDDGPFGLNTFCDKEGHPVSICYSRHIDWKKVTVKQFQKTSVWCFLNLCRTTERVQTHGIAFIFLLKDIAMSQIKMEFETFILKVMQECLPMKFVALEAVHEPFFMSHIIWPLFKPLMKKKLKERMHWHGHKGFEKTLHPKYTAEQLARIIPKEAGGGFELDVEAFFKAVGREHPHTRFYTPTVVDGVEVEKRPDYSD